MKSVALAMCLIAALAFAQDRPVTQEITNSARQPTTISAKSIQRDQADPLIVRLKGDVQITSSGVIVKADEAVFNMGTDEIEPLGNVRVKLTTH